MAPTARSFAWEGHRLVYDEYGSGDRVVVLTPGLLFNKRMHGPLAEALAERGMRLLCLDLLGHGDSDRPAEMWSYSMLRFGRQVIALLDHLEIDRAVVGGTSLGANTTLEAAHAAPDRVRGMILDMPVLDNALLGCAIGFTPLLLNLTFGAPNMRALAAVTRRIPRRGPLLGQMLLDWVSQDPKPSASVVQGLFFGRVAPPREERRELAAPALVIGHPRDPIHPFSDADMLVHELPSARLIHAASILELRTTPRRLTGQIVAFAERCFDDDGSARAPRAKSSRNGAGTRRGARAKSSS